MNHISGIWRALFAGYCLVMGLLLFGRAEAPEGIPYLQQLTQRLNLVPFRTLVHQLQLLTEFDRPWLIRHASINLLGNVLLFMPLGIFLPRLCFRQPRLWKVLVTAAAIVIAVEAAQVLTLLGRCDVDDLILNLAGAAMGYGLHKRTLRRPSGSRAELTG